MSKVKHIYKIDDIEGVKLPRYKYKDVDDRFVKTYQSVLAILLCLPDCSAKLIQYLSSKMSDENIVHHNKFTRENFNKYIYSIWLEYYKANEETESNAHELAKEKMYKDNTIKKAFSILVNKNLLVQKTRGMYIVNPEYFFKKGDEERYRKIKLTLEIQKGFDDITLGIEGE